MLAGRPDRRHPELGPQLGAQAVRRLTWRQPQQPVRGAQVRRAVVDDEHAPLGQRIAVIASASWPVRFSSSAR